MLGRGRWEADALRDIVRDYALATLAEADAVLVLDETGFCADGSAQGRWVAADSVYGVGEIETALRRAGKGYVLGVNGAHPFNAWGDKPLVAGTAEEIARTLPASAWARLSAGAGTKGARLHDWADLELADLDAAEHDDGRSGLWTRGLLVRRSIADGELAFSTWCPTGTKIAMLAVIRHQANAPTPPKSRSASPRRAGSHPLVGPGDPPHRRPSRAAMQPAQVIAWSLWRRAHRAAAQRSYLKQRTQL